MKKRVLEYNTIFEKETDGGYSVWVPDLPGCASQGDSFEEAVENIKEAIGLYLEEAEDEYIQAGKEHKDQFLIPVQISS